MTQAKHTPGPWYAYNGQIRCGKGIICEMQRVTEETPIKLLERDANARLIAAAPELLEALQEALCSLVYAADALQVPEDCQFQDTIKQVRAAIAKATGE